MSASSRAPARRRWLSIGAACVLLAVLSAPSTASAGDYERNDVSGREVSLVVGRVSVEGGPLGFLVRGTARRHRRFFYLASELNLGVTTDPAPFVGIGVSAGFESSDNGSQRLRGYVEVGAALQWANSSLYDTLNFFTEAGVRIQLQRDRRPHMILHLGPRLSTSFKTYGLALVGGVGWTFD